MKSVEDSASPEDVFAERDVPKKLDLGCGHNKVEGALGVDQYPHGDAEIIQDLEETPWRLPSNYFEEIYINHCLEHLANWKSALKEIYRLAAPGAKVVIRVPHASRSPLDPDHETHFLFGSMEKFAQPGEEQYIGSVHFEVKQARIHWRMYKDRGNLDASKNYFLNPLGSLIDLLVNLNDSTREIAERFCFFPFNGFEEIHWELEVVK